jgi:GTP cyclohydrolase I
VARTPTREQRRSRAERALRDLLTALGCELEGELRGTPRRAAELWSRYLLDGEHQDPAAILGSGSRTRSRAPVTLFNVGVHLVCPHHLTVAFGLAHVGYLPNGRVAGFGALARLIHAGTARLVLQEDASNAIAAAIVEQMGATAAVAVIDAMHPCHNVPHARSHRARAVTWGESGTGAGVRQLRGLVKAGMTASKR